MQSKASSKFRISSSGIAEPPDMQSRSDEVSKSSRLSECSIALYIVGTPWKIVTLSRSMISSALSGSKRGIWVIMAPTAKQAFMLQVWPKEWNSGSAPSAMSSSVVLASPTATSAFFFMFEWVSSAPLGLPVVPDV